MIKAIRFINELVKNNLGFDEQAAIVGISKKV